MIYYCPRCWQQVASLFQSCRRCGTDPREFTYEESFVSKLLHAVSHPEPLTARRAIWILGEKRCVDAVPAFEKPVNSKPDIYQLLAIIDALGKIGTERASLLLQRLGEHPSRIISNAAQEELRRQPSPVTRS